MRIRREEGTLIPHLLMSCSATYSQAPTSSTESSSTLGNFAMQRHPASSRTEAFGRAPPKLEPAASRSLMSASISTAALPSARAADRSERSNRFLPHRFGMTSSRAPNDRSPREWKEPSPKGMSGAKLNARASSRYEGAYLSSRSLRRAECSDTSGPQEHLPPRSARSRHTPYDCLLTRRGVSCSARIRPIGVRNGSVASSIS